MAPEQPVAEVVEVGRPGSHLGEQPLQRLDAVLDVAVTALDEPVGVEHEGRPGLQRDHAFVAGGCGVEAEQQVVGVGVGEPGDGPVVVDEQRRRVPGM